MTRQESNDKPSGLSYACFQTEGGKILERPSALPLVQARHWLSQLKIYLDRQTETVSDDVRPAYLAAAIIVEEAVNKLDPIKLIQDATQKPKPVFLPAREEYGRKNESEVKLFDIDGKELVTIKQAAKEIGFNPESAKQYVRDCSGLDPSANLATLSQAGLYNKDAIIDFLTKVQNIRKAGHYMKRK